MERMETPYVREKLRIDLLEHLQPGNHLIKRSGGHGAPKEFLYTVEAVNGNQVCFDGRWEELKDYDSPSMWHSWRRATPEEAGKLGKATALEAIEEINWAKQPLAKLQAVLDIIRKK